MINTLKKLSSALAANLTPPDGVHFHAGPAGPYVCESRTCSSPGLDVGS